MISNANEVVGVGCFAGQGTLSRVLRKMIESYSQGEAGDVVHGRADAPDDGCMLRELLSGIGKETAAPREKAVATDSNVEKIAGFFLTFKNQQLSLSVFTRGGGLKREKYQFIWDGTPGRMSVRTWPAGARVS
jgi:hypothetical protein